MSTFQAQRYIPGFEWSCVFVLKTLTDQGAAVPRPLGALNLSGVGSIVNTERQVFLLPNSGIDVIDGDAGKLRVKLTAAQTLQLGHGRLSVQVINEPPAARRPLFTAIVGA